MKDMIVIVEQTVAEKAQSGILESSHSHTSILGLSPLVTGLITSTNIVLFIHHTSPWSICYDSQHTLASLGKRALIPVLSITAKVVLFFSLLSTAWRCKLQLCNQCSLSSKLLQLSPLRVQPCQSPPSSAWSSGELIQPATDTTARLDLEKHPELTVCPAQFMLALSCQRSPHRLVPFLFPQRFPHGWEWWNLAPFAPDSSLSLTRLVSEEASPCF